MLVLVSVLASLLYDTVIVDIAVVVNAAAVVVIAVVAVSACVTSPL